MRRTVPIKHRFYSFCANADEYHVRSVIFHLRCYLCDGEGSNLNDRFCGPLMPRIRLNQKSAIERQYRLQKSRLV